MWPFDGSEKEVTTVTGEKILIDAAKVSLCKPHTKIDGNTVVALIVVEGVEVLVTCDDYNVLYQTLFG